MSRPRILFVAAGACAVIAAVYLPPSGSDLWERWRSLYSSEREYANRLRGDLWRGRQALTLLEFRDSALARATPFVEGMRLYIDPAVPNRLADSLRQLVRDSVPGLLDEASPPFVLGVFLDSLRERDGFRALPPQREPLTHYFVPDAAPAPCITITAIGSDIRSSILDLEPGEPFRPPYSLSDLLGPCRYLARLGYPAAPMAEWIRTGMVEGDPVLAARCSRHELPACERVLFRNPYWHPSPWGTEAFSLRGGAGFGVVPRFAPSDRRLLDTFDDSLPAGALPALWASADSIPATFSRVSGIDLRAWYADIIQPDPRFQPQPAVGVAPVLLAEAALVCGLAFLLAASIAARRQSG